MSNNHNPYPGEPALLPENVYGHTKKVRLIRESLSSLRSELGRGLRILDIGCGNGYAVTRFLAHPEDEVVAIDLHEPSIGYAIENFSSLGIDFRVMPAEQLEVLGERFDAIVLADVLEHVDDPVLLLKGAGSLLNENGRILASIPNGYGPFEIESAMSRIPLLGAGSIKLVDWLVATMNKWIFRDAWTRLNVGMDIPYNMGSPHIHFFSRKSFLSIVDRAHLSARKHRNLSFLSGPYTNYFFAPSRVFCQWNTAVSEKLPCWMVSAWYFELAAGESGC